MRAEPVVRPLLEALPAPASESRTPADERAEHIMRSSRAELARLSLELRAIRHKADVAEHTHVAVAPSPVAAGVDLPGARELLRSSLGEWVNTRREELAAELEEARHEAARIVASAHRRAEAYVAEAHDGVLATLLHPEQQLAPLPPLPPVVVPDELARQAPAPARTDIAAAAGSSEAAATVAAILAAVQPPLATVADTPPASPRPPMWRRLLYADVLLPMIAALAVLIVLLAWVG